VPPGGATLIRRPYSAFRDERPPLAEGPMEVTFLEESRFAWARFSGPWTIDEICAQVEPLVAECLSRKHRLLLIDWTLLEPQRISTLERYRLSQSAQPFRDNHIKVATVLQAVMIDAEKFGERVAQNRGVNVRTFSDLGEAERWLLKKGR